MYESSAFSNKTLQYIIVPVLFNMKLVFSEPLLHSFQSCDRDNKRHTGDRDVLRFPDFVFF